MVTAVIVCRGRPPATGGGGRRGGVPAGPPHHRGRPAVPAGHPAGVCVAADVPGAARPCATPRLLPPFRSPAGHLRAHPRGCLVLSQSSCCRASSYPIGRACGWAHRPANPVSLISACSPKYFCSTASAPTCSKLHRPQRDAPITSQQDLCLRVGLSLNALCLHWPFEIDYLVSASSLVAVGPCLDRR